MKARRSNIITFRVPPELRARIEAAAQAERRSISQVIELCVEAHLSRLEGGANSALAQQAAFFASAGLW